MRLTIYNTLESLRKWGPITSIKSCETDINLIDLWSLFCIENQYSKIKNLLATPHWKLIWVYIIIHQRMFFSLFSSYYPKKTPKRIYATNIHWKRIYDVWVYIFFFIKWKSPKLKASAHVSLHAEHIVIQKNKICYVQIIFWFILWMKKFRCLIHKTHWVWRNHADVQHSLGL